MYKGNRTRACPQCGKFIQSLGWARHRSMHYDHRMKEEARQKSLEGVTLQPATRQGMPCSSINECLFLNDLKSIVNVSL